MTSDDSLFIDADGDPEAERVIDAWWPADGPHTRGTVAASAIAIEKLAHYLARALNTTPTAVTCPTATTWAGSSPSSRRRRAVLTRSWVASMPGPARCRPNPPSTTTATATSTRPGATVTELAGALQVSRQHLAELTRSLRDAEAAANHLGHREA